MNEELDDELRKRISEVFDHYGEDTTAADEGWLKLREKFPPQNQRRITGVWAWRGAAAAVLLLLCMFGLWLVKRNEPENQLVVKPGKPSVQQPASKGLQQPSPEDSSAGQVPSSANSTNAGYRPQSLDAVTAGQTPLLAGKKRQSAKASYNKIHAPVTGDDAYANINIKPTKTSENKGSTLDVIANQPATGRVITEQGTANGQVSAGNDPANPDNDDTRTKQLLAVTRQKDTTSQNIIKKPGMNELFAREAQERANKSKDDKRTDAEKRIIYSVYAGTYVNYAKGSSTQANVGAGFTSDIRLVGNLKLSTGLAIAQNKLDYNTEPAQPNLRTAAVQASRINNTQVSAMNLAMPNKISEFAPRNGVSSVSVRSYNVSLTGIDVPINLKYEFNPKKTDSYISAGLSSGTFINETYHYQYDNSLQDAFGLNSDAIPDASTSTSFSRFDFARTLNVAVGLGMPLGKSNRLVIEPFVKYPLSGLGSQDIRFGAGGLNLKLKFQKSKK